MNYLTHLKNYRAHPENEHLRFQKYTRLGVQLNVFYIRTANGGSWRKIGYGMDDYQSGAQLRSNGGSLRTKFSTVQIWTFQNFFRVLIEFECIFGLHRILSAGAENDILCKS